MAAVTARMMLALVAAILMESAIRKAASPGVLREAMASWPLPRGPWLKFGLMLPRMELLLGSFGLWASLLDAWLPAAAIALAVAFAGFTAIQVWLLLQTAETRCGCFGKTEPVSVHSALRPAIMGTLALMPLLAQFR